MSKEFDEMVEKVINAIDQIAVNTTIEQREKIMIEYFMRKMCESEEIFNDNLKILDKHSQNGLRKRGK